MPISWDESICEDPINIKAVEILGDLHDALAEGGYSGHDLERFLMRVLFCLFAEDTGLFEPEIFTLYLESRTAKDGSDLYEHYTSPLLPVEKARRGTKKRV